MDPTHDQAHATDRIRRGGYTLVQVIIASTLVAILSLLVTPLVQMSRAENDARLLLKQQAENASGRILNNLREAKRVYYRRTTQYNNYPTPDIVEDFFSGAIDLTESPPPLSGTVLPEQWQDWTTDRPRYSDGNSLLFVRQMPSLEVNGGTKDIPINIYQFYYYYIAIDPRAAPIGTLPPRQLYEWKSVFYADVGQLSRISTAGGAQKSAIQNLRAKGIFWAYNISLLKFTGAFSQMTIDGAITPALNHRIVRSSLEALTKSSGGRIYSNYRLGVSPNTNDLNSVGIPTQIDFSDIGFNSPSPSGFLVGTPPRHQRGSSTLNLYIVLALSGPIKDPIMQYEHVIAVNVQDIW